ncbi:MAG: 4-hydroxy-tetrahydrodipicolinate synthase [Turicibacter sp.]|nr:4-hydroxy-tetrahydrodipicolinate synthase [Turicibacter sp.]
MNKLTGSTVALVTPFHADGSINYEKLEQLIDYHIENKTDCILILGTTGESPTITFEEEQVIVAHTIKYANGRVPIMVGSGSNDTAQAIVSSQTFEKLGADYLLVLTPYYNRTNESGMIKHFEAIADAVTIPIMMYNVPGRTGCAISEQAVEVLAKHPNIMGIKEASGDFNYMTRISRYVSDDFALYTGNDDTVVPALSLGASGIVSVWANVMPREVHDLVDAYLNGDTKKSLAILHENLAFINALFIETNPIPVKHVMNELGFEVGPFRAPLDNPSEACQATLQAAMRSVNLKK